MTAHPPQIYRKVRKNTRGQMNEGEKGSGGMHTWASKSALVILDELGVVEVLLGEAGGHLDDDVAGDGEAGKEGPVASPLPPEEDRPRIELLHLLLSSISLLGRPRAGWFGLGKRRHGQRKAVNLASPLLHVGPA
ncbi:hypothetical protein ABZP36_017723 [Zizania latifolia]